MSIFNLFQKRRFYEYVGLYVIFFNVCSPLFPSFMNQFHEFCTVLVSCVAVEFKMINEYKELRPHVPLYRYLLVYHLVLVGRYSWLYLQERNFRRAKIQPIALLYFSNLAQHCYSIGGFFIAHRLLATKLNFSSENFLNLWNRPIIGFMTYLFFILGTDKKLKVKN